MDIWETDKLVLFIAFVIPGFISIKVYDLLSYRNKVKSAELIIEAITYSSINYAILAAPILFIENYKLNSEHPIWYGVFYFIVLFISPILITWGWNKLRKSNFFQDKMTHPIAKPWDYIFLRENYIGLKLLLKVGN